MKDLNYAIRIHAPGQKVWDVLWGKNSYSQWTKFFNPTSYMESDWKVGGKTLFLDGNQNGMISTIKTLDAPHTVAFEHRGEIMNGVEDTTSEKVKAYAGAIEQYTLTEEDGVTRLDVWVQSFEGFEEMMNKGFENGLQVVKELAEKQ